eukprot:1158454-Pelagomonas_calceolata.AAC.5
MSLHFPPGKARILFKETGNAQALQGSSDTHHAGASDAVRLLRAQLCWLSGGTSSMDVFGICVGPTDGSTQCPANIASPR